MGMQRLKKMWQRRRDLNPAGLPDLPHFECGPFSPLGYSLRALRRSLKKSFMIWLHHLLAHLMPVQVHDLNQGERAH